MSETNPSHINLSKWKSETLKQTRDFYNTHKSFLIEQAANGNQNEKMFAEFVLQVGEAQT
jgi:hypothetical protein